nr:MAG TPA: Phenol hydroxylase conserved region [Caudoviricetes sp.]
MGGRAPKSVLLWYRARKGDEQNHLLFCTPI